MTASLHTSSTNAGNTKTYSTGALVPWFVLGLAAWFALTAAIGMSGFVAAGPDQAFRPVLVTVVVPIAVFLALFAGSDRVRDFVLTRDLRVVTMLQAWRIIGFAFLPLYAYGVLPGLFAWPAGLGDVAIGLSTPLIVLALARQPGFAHSRKFVVWNLLGMLDFVVAAGTSTLASGAFPGLFAGSVTAAPMEVWPLVLFPAFIVPLFAILHLTVFLQLWATRPARVVKDRAHIVTS